VKVGQRHRTAQVVQELLIRSRRTRGFLLEYRFLSNQWQEPTRKR